MVGVRRRICRGPPTNPARIVKQRKQQPAEQHNGATHIDAAVQRSTSDVCSGELTRIKYTILL
jgi:hypothetical protein